MLKVCWTGIGLRLDKYSYENEKLDMVIMYSIYRVLIVQMLADEITYWISGNKYSVAR